MSWILIALISYFLLAIVTVFDKFILSKKLPHPTAYAFYLSVVNIFVLVLMPFGFEWPSAGAAAIALFSGALFFAGLVFLFRGIIAFEASRVAPVVGALMPFFLFLFSYLKEDFMLTPFQIVAMVLLVLGGFILSYKRIEHGNSIRLFTLAALASLFLALSYFFEKIAYTQTNFLTGFITARFGTFVAALFLLLLPSVRKEIFSVTRESAEHRPVFLVGANKAIASLALFGARYAMFLGNVVLVQAMEGVRYVFLIFILFVLSWKFPNIFQEKAGLPTIARKVGAVLLVGLGIFILAFSEKPAGLSPGVNSFGVTFSIKYAKDMKLDWREAYLAVLDDLKVKHLRIPAYWDETELGEGRFNFDDLDWQLAEAEKREAKVILSIGYRLPRWPECHIPDWAKDKPRADFENDALGYLKTTIERYRANDAVIYWQIENEPFLRGFGECPKFSVEFLDKEIALARSLDPRPIIISDSGELSLWFQAAKRADIFGTTMYRAIWNKYLGYFNYPLPPEFFHFKANIVRSFGTMRRAIVIELQAEPWGPKMAYDLSPEEETRSFSPQKFRDNIEYAKAVGFPEVYLWGAEWWYWKKEKGDERYWEIAKEVFKY